MTNPWSELATKRIGDTGPLIVWIHGLGESSLCFQAISRHSALQGYRHVLVDLPGYGHSPRPDEAYRLDEAATELASWLPTLGEPAILIGHSMGGVLAQLVAERAPTTARAVVDVDGNISLGDCGFSSKVAAYPLNVFLASGFDELRDQVYRDGVDNLPLRGYYASMCLADPKVIHRHSLDLVEMSTREDLAVRLTKLAVPSLYIAGSPDGAAKRSKELLVASVARWMIVEPAGHWPFLDQPDAFANLVADFLGPIVDKK
jgi:pimeloyl-ACP methyl ester carboxylesterase